MPTAHGALITRILQRHSSTRAAPRLLGILAVALTLASTPLAAQEGATRLRYTAPEGWTPSLDGKALQAPGGGAGVTFLASAPFTGTAEQWLEAAWSGILRELQLASVPAPGAQGPFLTRLGLFQQADGSTVWLSLITIVRDGRGEGVVYFATGEAQFQANLAGLSRMLVGIANAPPPLAAPPGPAIATRPEPDVLEIRQTKYRRGAAPPSAGPSALPAEHR